MKFSLSFILILSINTLVYGQKIIEDIGHYTQLGLPLSAIGISIVKGDTDGLVQLVKSFAVQTSTTVILKRAINRTRPSGGRYSFPSGHTSVSFMSSTYIWKRYGWEFGLPSTAMAAFVGFSRFGIDEPVHYFSDVVVGCAIGVGSSWLFTKRRDSKVKLDVTGDMSFLGVNLKINLN
ncbi:MAG: phosphatase PAP2 family protein [Bacteroidota bacterium]